MTHDEAVPLLPAYVDSELAKAPALAMKEHLRLCERCREDYASMQRVKNAVRRDGRYHTAPRELRAAFAVTGDSAEPSWLARLFGLPWASPALAAGLAAVLSSLITLQLVTPADSDRTSEEIISNHVRSLMTQHLVDVTSTEKHTVKPWFAGRLAFSPPVEDFASAGFQLIGGRLEYLTEQPVATLVYQHGGHFINVYVRPNERGRTTEIKPTERQGFNLLDWSDRSFTYDAVSDLNTEELRALVKDLQAARAEP